MLTSGSIIDQARGRHAGFDISRHPNKVVLQFLSAFTKQLHGRIAKIDDEALRLDATFPLPLANFAAGIPLPMNRNVVEVLAVEPTNGRRFPLNIVPMRARHDRNVSIGACWIEGSTLFLSFPEQNWQNMSAIVVGYIPVPVPLANLNDVLAVPDTAELACVESCAAFMAKRMPIDPKGGTAQYEVFKTDAAEAERAFLEDIINRQTGQTFQTRDVYNPMDAPNNYRL